MTGGRPGAVHDRAVAGTDANTVTDASTEIHWDPKSRVALVRYGQGASLTAGAGVVLVEALTGWIGEGSEPFAVLADCAGLRATDGEYRAKASTFFRQHRQTAFIALFHVGPVISVVVDMFRVGTGIQLKALDSEAAARFWLRVRGIAA